MTKWFALGSALFGALALGFIARGTLTPAKKDPPLARMFDSEKAVPLWKDRVAELERRVLEQQSALATYRIAERNRGKSLERGTGDEPAPQSGSAESEYTRHLDSQLDAMGLSRVPGDAEAEIRDLVESSAFRAHDATYRCAGEVCSVTLHSSPDVRVDDRIAQLMDLRSKDFGSRIVLNAADGSKRVFLALNGRFLEPAAPTSRDSDEPPNPEPRVVYLAAGQGEDPRDTPPEDPAF